jgi:multidrug efflux pump subunit AcrA (membrane-fusion protein)
MKRWLIFLGFLALLSLVGGAGYLGYQNARPPVETTPVKPVTVPVTQGDVQHTVTAPGQLVGTQEVILGMDVSGRLVELTVRPGSIVKSGDVIARIDPTPYENNLATAEIELAQAQAAYERQLAEAELSTQNSEALVGSAQAQFPGLTTAEVNLQAAIDAEAWAENEYNKALDRPWEQPHVLEAYRVEWERAQDRRQIAQAEYDAVLNQRWAVGQQIAALQTDVERANLAAQFLQESGINPLLSMAVSQAETALAATVLTAPCDGTVLEVFARPGEFIVAGASIILLADPFQAEVRTTVIEEDLSLVEIGQPAELFFDARPEIGVGGVVSRIVPRRVVGEARPLYHVYINLEDTLPEGVFSGMTVDAAIIVAAETDVLRLPRALVRPKSDGTAVIELWQNDRPVQRDITVGLRGDVYITIEDGLQVGEEVIAE